MKRLSREELYGEQWRGMTHQIGYGQKDRNAVTDQ